MRKKFTLALLLFPTISVLAQESGKPDLGTLSGNFQSNAQFYDRDDRIGANTTQYLREKASVDAWLFLNYQVRGFEFQLRYDHFLNSPLLNPAIAYSNQGIGFWSIKKSLDKLDITAGYFYDQFGSGQIFRAYVDNLIGLDYAMQGVRLQYNFSDNFFVKAFSGQQKGFLNLSTNEDTRFKMSPQVMQGINSEYFWLLNSDWSFNFGAAAVKRNLDQATMNQLVGQINALPLSERFTPKYNTYAYSAYSTINYKNFSLYLEYSGKTAEALRDPLDVRLFSAPGNVYTSSLSYSRKGLGINLQYKKIDRFQFRTSPYAVLLNGTVNYLPSITRQNTYRLLARYNPAVQEMGETAIAGELIYSPTKKMTFNVNYSNVVSSRNEHLFTEYYIDMNYKINDKFKLILGLQSIFYNQRIYETSPSAPDVTTITPFAELTYKIDKRKSLRFEAQYLESKQDQGSFLNALVEYNVSPHWSLSVGDMVNIAPVRTPGTPQATITNEQIHYYNVYGSYTMKNNKFGLGYIKQVQGVNCTGGICRIEPAFSGVRFSLTTTF